MIINIFREPYCLVNHAFLELLAYSYGIGLTKAERSRKAEAERRREEVCIWRCTRKNESGRKPRAITREREDVQSSVTTLRGVP